MSKEIVAFASPGFRETHKQWLAVLLACLVCFAPGLRAEAPPQDVQDAHALAVDGQREFNLGNYETALDLLQRSYKKNPLPAVLYNVAQCQRLLGHLEQARRVYKAFLAAAPDSAAAPFAKEKIAELDLALKAQTNAEHAAPQTLTRTEKPPPEESEPAAPAPGAESKTAASTQPAPPTVLVVSAPPAALPGAKQPPADKASWGWWVAGGAVAVAAVVVVVVLASSSSKSVSEPSGTFSAR